MGAQIRDLLTPFHTLSKSIQTRAIRMEEPREIRVELLTIKSSSKKVTLKMMKKNRSSQFRKAKLL